MSVQHRHVVGSMVSESAERDSGRARPAGLPAAILKVLLERIGYGVLPAELAKAQAIGYDAYLDEQLSDSAGFEDSLDAFVQSRCPVETLTSAQLWAYSDVTALAQAQEAMMWRAMKSGFQLYQRMVEFWNDHFNLFGGKPGLWNLLPVDRRTVIRAHALDSFPALLRASTKSAAALYYLDNQLSTAAHPNENYARELLELYSLGADNGYTQQDVMETARCFTGWGVTPFGSQPTSGLFTFNAADHDYGAKTVMGLAIPAGGGQSDAEQVVEMLAMHPNTAGFICGKLARWFLGEGVEAAVVQKAADIYLATDGDIRSILRFLLQPGVVFGSAPKFKRPFHLYISALRLLPATYSIYGLGNQRARLSAAGHLPYTFATPNGAPDRNDAWKALLLPRWNYFSELCAGVIWDTSIDLNTFFQGTTNAQQVANAIDAQIFSNLMDPADKVDVLAFLNGGTLNATRKAEALALALSSPGFQWF